uniref:Uncharacterized protein n=1 Tax=Zonotrichia albicollis TaxID=44394 RepID=A0A8D2NG07_ZONAL
MEDYGREIPPGSRNAARQRQALPPTAVPVHRDPIADRQGGNVYIPAVCGLSPALFSRAVPAQGQALAELLCSVSLQVTESFLSKEVTCVVSSNREAKRGQPRAREEKQNNPTAESTKSTSSVPAAPKGTPARAHQKPPYTVRAMRVLTEGRNCKQISWSGAMLAWLSDAILPSNSRFVCTECATVTFATASTLSSTEGGTLGKFVPKRLFLLMNLEVQS